MRFALALVLVAAACRPTSGAPASASGAPARIADEARARRHPRLWVRADELPALRARATARNPMWRALMETAERARAAMDEGKVPSGPNCTDGGVYYCESYAE